MVAKKKLSQKVSENADKGARKKMLEEMKYDFGRPKGEIYRVNFLRGIFFGLGSALGGTLVVAIAVWLLTRLEGLVPFLGRFIKDIINSMG